MKTTRPIETNAHPKEEGTIRYWANCIAWFSKLKNISQVTIKKVHPICNVASINYVALNRSNVVVLNVLNLITIKDLAHFAMQKEHFTKHLSPELGNVTQQINTCSK